MLREQVNKMEKDKFAYTESNCKKSNQIHSLKAEN